MSFKDNPFGRNMNQATPKAWNKTIHIKTIPQLHNQPQLHTENIDDERKITYF